MNVQARISSVGSVAPVAGARGPRVSSSSLLPSPNMDPMCAIYALTSKQRDTNSLTASAQAHEKRMEEREIAKDIERKIAEQKKAEEERSFWDSVVDIFTGIATAASAVAAVATGGALAIGAAALSIAAFTDSQAKILEKLGVDPAAVAWIHIGASVTSVGMSIGSGVIGEAATSWLGNPGKVLSGVGRMTQGVSTVEQGTAKVMSTIQQKEADDAFIASESSKVSLKKVLRDQDKILATYKESARSYQHSLSLLVDSLNTKNETLEILSNRKV